MVLTKKIAQTMVTGIATRSRGFNHHYIPKPTFSKSPLTSHDYLEELKNLQHKVQCLEHSLIDLKQEMLRLDVVYRQSSTSIVEPTEYDSEIYVHPNSDSG